MIFFTKYLLIVVVLLLGSSLTANATPPKRSQLPEFVTTSLRFLPGHSPNSEGEFEIEIYCKARFALEEVELAVGQSDEISFEKDPPSFYGTMRAGVTKRWTLKGTIHKNPYFDGSAIPASITFAVKYLFPYEAVLKQTENRYGKDTILGIIEVENNVNPHFYNSYLFKIIEEQKGKTKSLIRALPVFKP